MTLEGGLGVGHLGRAESLDKNRLFRSADALEADAVQGQLLGHPGRARRRHDVAAARRGHSSLRHDAVLQGDVPDLRLGRVVVSDESA